MRPRTTQYNYERPVRPRQRCAEPEDAADASERHHHRLQLRFRVYNYDSVSHLLSVLHQAGSTTLDGAGYDYAGNRTSKTNYLNGITSNYGSMRFTSSRR